jgi:Flp pilus assembly protein CpaB
MIMKTRLIGAILAILLATAGAVVLIGYVRTADARAADGAEFVTAYVVTKEIPSGTPAEQIGNLITARQIPALAAVPGRVTTLAKLAGLVSDVTLMPGEQLLSSRWVDAAKLASGTVAVPDGMQAVTIALPVERVVGGTIKAGDTVGVVIAASVKLGSSAEAPITKQAFHKVLVVSVQQGTVVTPKKAATDAPSDPVSAVMVTLARTTPDVEKLIWGQQFGTVWLTLETAKASEIGSRPVDGSIVFQ